jgi:hypothetical protein|nr:MAG TPA: hypothetical protein [Caudoviricetes sp.]
MKLGCSPVDDKYKINQGGQKCLSVILLKPTA